ncbi:MAG: multidrug effflux MFS transporter [Niabella sp.]
MQKNKYIRILILGLLSAIGPFSIDMYLPGFPAIAKDLHSDISQVSLTLSSFFIGISVGQLLYGPILDKFGRKKPLYFGLSIYILASIGCMFAYSIEALIGLRFLQALGGCVGMVASRAIVRDLFSVEENAKIFSLLMLVIGVSPIIAPTLGGYVATHLGWRYIFLILTLIGAVILALVFFLLPESKKPDSDYSLKPKFILNRFGIVFKEPQFVTYAITGAFTAAGLYAYIAGSPHVFMEIFGASETVYGWIFAIIAGGLIVATQLNTQLLKKFTSEHIIPRAIIFQLLTGMLLVIGFWLQWWEVYSSVILCCIFLACQGFTFPNASALALAPFTENAGSASALLGCIQMAVGTLTSALVSIFHNPTAVPMGLVMACCSATALTVLLLGRKAIKYKATLEKVEEQSVDMIQEV